MIVIQCPTAKRVGGNAGQPFASRKRIRSWRHKNHTVLSLEKISRVRSGRRGAVGWDLFVGGEKLGLRGRRHSQPAE